MKGGGGKGPPKGGLTMGAAPPKYDEKRVALLAQAEDLGLSGLDPLDTAAIAARVEEAQHLANGYDAQGRSTEEIAFGLSRAEIDASWEASMKKCMRASDADLVGLTPDELRAVGNCYETGENTIGEHVHAQDSAKAFELYTKAAMAGSLWAFVNMADCLKEGRGVEQDLERANACRVHVKQAAMRMMQEVGDAAFTSALEYGVDDVTTLLKADINKVHEQYVQGK